MLCCFHRKLIDEFILNLKKLRDTCSYMEYDEEKIDKIVLALLFLTSFTMQGQIRAWKGQDWEVLNRLYEKGLIGDPKSKSKSVVLSQEGAQRSEELFWQYFGKHS